MLGQVDGVIMASLSTSEMSRDIIEDLDGYQ